MSRNILHESTSVSTPSHHPNYITNTIFYFPAADTEDRKVVKLKTENRIRNYEPEAFQRRTRRSNQK